MKPKLRFIAFLFIIWLSLVLLSACGGSAEYDIRGTWEYTMIDSNGNTYDQGTITFSGELTRGTYLELNIYQVEYSGDYQVRGTSLNLTGHEPWQGTLTGVDTMNGTWQYDDGSSGTWTAVRQAP